MGKKTLPYVAIGNNELKNQPDVVEGTKISHQHENGEWEEAEIKYGEKVNDDGTKEKSGIIGYYTLKNGSSYSAAVAGKLMNRVNLKLAKLLNKKTNEDGSVTQTNYMLDDVIEAFDKHAENMDIHFGANDELIKEMTIQKIEYGRNCIAQLLSQGGQTLQTMKCCYQKLDTMLQSKITEVGGNPKKINLFN